MIEHEASRTGWPRKVGEVASVHDAFSRFVAAPHAADVALPHSEGRLLAMSQAGMAQALATYDELSQRYGTGVDYFTGTRELMTVATSVCGARRCRVVSDCLNSPVACAVMVRGSG